MKKIFFMLLACVMLASFSSCRERIDAGHEGIKFNKYGSTKGVDDVALVSGIVWYNPITTAIYEYPTFVQTIDYPAFDLQSKDGSTFNIDPKVQLNLMPGKAGEVFVKYRLKFKEIVNETLLPFVYNAYRIELNKFDANELISNREQFESAVEQRLRADLAKEGFMLGECTSGLTPPKSLVAAINAKNKAVQEQLKVENEVRVAEAQAKKKIVLAQAEAEANRLLNSSLTPAVLESRRLDVMEKKWNGAPPQVSADGVRITKII